MTTRIGSLAFRDIAEFFVAIMERYVQFKIYIINLAIKFMQFKKFNFYMFL